ncbi:hypothetical protein ACH4UT_28635 [Streptomyces sp. NPDC020799]|uniref:hypothetical protein n=1 Tax=Streptomyces sp. NPDC020799 TaxID=3365091 RepID=UPI0037A04A69
MKHEADREPDPDRREDEVADLGAFRSERNPSAEKATSGDPEAVINVDRPGGPTGPGLLGRIRGARRRPVIPAWARSRQEFKAAGKGLFAYTWHITAYHSVRTPWYAARLALQAPTGAARFVGGALQWVADAEGEPLRQAAATSGDVGDYLSLSRQRDRRVRWRAVVMVAASVVGLATALSMYILAPSWLLALCGSVATMAMGWLGQPADAPVIQRAVEIPKAQKLTSDIVLRALGSLGIGAINQAQSKGGSGFTFTAPITRDGAGWRAEGDLPYGVTVTDVIDKRDRLASGLRLSASFEKWAGIDR